MRTKAAHMETRDIAAILIGLQVGLVLGLLTVGTTLLAPFAVGAPRRRRGLRRATRTAGADPPGTSFAAARGPITSAPCRT